MFIKDKIIPDKIEDFIINKTETLKLEKLFNKTFMNNLLIYGPLGCGKFT